MRPARAGRRAAAGRRRRPSSSRRSPSATWPQAAGRGLPADLLTDAPAHLVADDSIDVIVELMGGDEPAHTLIAAALGDGQGRRDGEQARPRASRPALEAVARRTGAALRFEAAVGGGIPVLGPLATTSPANRIDRVRGIVNGTTNYILTAMTDRDGAARLRDALAEAQRLGYAEADPSGDVEGLDAVNKLVILARLAFGRWLDPRRHRHAAADGRDGPAGPGITGVTPPTSARPRPPAGSSVSWRRHRWTRTRRSPPSVLPDGVAARLAARADGRGAQPDRGRAVPRRPGRLRRPRRGWRRDVIGRARRPDGDRPRRGLDMGRAGARDARATSRRSGPSGATSSRPRAASRYPIDD